MMPHSEQSQVHQQQQLLSVSPQVPLPLNQPQCPHMRKEGVWHSSDGRMVIPAKSTGADILSIYEAPVQILDLRTGDSVLAKWSDGKLYRATVEYISGKDQTQSPKGCQTPQESFLNMLEANEPSHSTSGSDTITVDQNPLSEHGSTTALNLPSDGELVTGSNTVGPPPPYGFTKEGTIGPSPYSGSTAIPSPYGLHINCQFPYGGHTSSLPPYGLNIKGPSPYEDHASCPSLHDFNTAGPSPNVYNTSGPSPGVHNPPDNKNPAFLAPDRRDAGNPSVEDTISYQPQAEKSWTPCDGCRKEFEKILREKQLIEEVLLKIDPGQVRVHQTLCDLETNTAMALLNNRASRCSFLRAAYSYHRSALLP
ncbi:uncharacterized protein LOC133655871 isoform X1 [Entelurus aequoreus]|uniref:uncharacterized protein LOC133655871 isoform X1 n=1 Tax=Entelurus aequoreus TaxID=161455 RepID=UPI002B1D78F7|nr:uncharacterized protein LOC133655871 isoform X1 [Entelurus aequoreus]